MNTPIYDFLAGYSATETVRAHMPGHKGFSPCEKAPENLYRLDITEICGADSLFEADGIIAESERNMSRLYGSFATAYSCGGSTLCIQAMLYLMKCEGRKIFAVRNVHRAFLNAAALLDLDVQWIMPEYCGGILSGEVDLSCVERLVAESAEPACVYVTSPDYTGKTADIAALSALCRRYGARLVVDGAHGAHLAFMRENIHPIALGADLCCDSAHKMLPALTGAAMLHSGRDFDSGSLKQAMSLFASTSPSYLILASLDLCADYIERRIRDDISGNIAAIERFEEKFSDRLSFAAGEPFHITINAGESGYNGAEFDDILRKTGIECEYADSSIVILLMSPLNRSEDLYRIETAVSAACESCHRIKPAAERFTLTLPPKGMSIREAVFAPSETIPVEESLGRICGAVRVPCPPAVPIAASGEIITEECINIFKRYGIFFVNVVK